MGRKEARKWERAIFSPQKPLSHSSPTSRYLIEQKKQYADVDELYMQEVFLLQIVGESQLANKRASMYTSEYQDQAKRLSELRRRSAEQQNFGKDALKLSTAGPEPGDEVVKDPLISSIPGIYAPSGFGIIDILLQVYQRPNPQIQIGNVDSSVALVLCDSDSPEHPIVYCSEPFERLTGYSSNEILGHNCRFLQHPPQIQPSSDKKVEEANEIARREVRAKIDAGLEARVHFTNYRKDGSPFTNILTLIPITWEGRHYIVGFQADEGMLYR